MAAKADELVQQLKSNGLRVTSDTRDNYTPGWKYNHWELKVRLQSSSSFWQVLAVPGHFHHWQLVLFCVVLFVIDSFLSFVVLFVIGSFWRVLVLFVTGCC